MHWPLLWSPSLVVLLVYNVVFHYEILYMTWRWPRAENLSWNKLHFAVKETVCYWWCGLVKMKQLLQRSLHTLQKVFPVGPYRAAPWRLVKCEVLVAKAKCSVQFLTSCRRYGVLPNFIVNISKPLNCLEVRFRVSRQDRVNEMCYMWSDRARYSFVRDSCGHLLLLSC